MRTRAVATPVWVKAIVAVVLIGVPLWWLADRHDRRVNEQRLGVIASEIAGRTVTVECPGPVARALMSYDTVEGSVRFDASGRPADRTDLRRGPCAELDALAEGRRGPQQACAERTPDCGEDVLMLARAVGVVTHEAFHLQGIVDEAVTECHALQAMAGVAQQLGASPEQAQGLARMQYEQSYPLMPAAYLSGDCRDGARLDQRPDDPVWP